MRIRPLIALSAVALAGVLLAGCSGSPDTSSSPDASGSASLCDSAAAGGTASKDVSVTGDAGAEPTVTFTSPLEVTKIERTVVSEGTGAKLQDGDMVHYSVVAFDASTGTKLGAAGFDGAASMPIAQVSAAGTGQFFGCAPVGSRIVLALPGTDDTAGQINVIDVVDATPADKWCQATDYSGAKPTVTFDDKGAPTITVPSSEKSPSSLVIDVLKEGTGDVVKPGDNVSANYTGVTWDDGKVFDSSWERGQPSSFATTDVVTGFQRALEGQKVGSTVLAIIPSDCGYGPVGSSSSELAGKTLVFVITIEGIKAGE